MSLRRFVALLVFAFVSVGMTACATAAASGGNSLEASAIALDWPASGKPLEHLDTFQNQVVKVGLISLRGGGQMPEHASPFPVLLTAASGRGTVTTARASYPLDPAHAVFLPGGERHSVTALEGEVLHIAVMALKSPGAAPVVHHGP